MFTMIKAADVLRDTPNLRTYTQFASRAKRIRVRRAVNETVDEGALIAKYKEEISLLRQQLSRAAAITHSPRRGATPCSSFFFCSSLQLLCVLAQVPVERRVDTNALQTHSLSQA